MVKTGIREGEIQARNKILTISSLLPDLSLVPCEFYVGTDLWGKSVAVAERNPSLKLGDSLCLGQQRAVGIKTEYRSL